MYPEPDFGPFLCVGHPRHTAEAAVQLLHSRSGQDKSRPPGADLRAACGRHGPEEPARAAPAPPPRHVTAAGPAPAGAVPPVSGCRGGAAVPRALRLSPLRAQHAPRRAARAAVGGRWRSNGRSPRPARALAARGDRSDRPDACASVPQGG